MSIESRLVHNGGEGTSRDDEEEEEEDDAYEIHNQLLTMCMRYICMVQYHFHENNNP